MFRQFKPTLSVYENIASPLRVARVERAEVERRVDQAARLLGLKPMLERTPLQLSGGQQQRVAIARALVKQAQLVLLDEPLANLDYKLREELREELPRLFAATGAILVYATTEPSEALLLGGNTATLWEGRITQVGPTAEVYRDPCNLPAARVFSDPPLNLFTAEIRGGVATVLGRSIPVAGVLAGLTDGRYHVGVRAEDTRLDDGAPDALSFEGSVLVTEITGSESFVHVAVGDPAQPATWVALVRGVHDVAPGAAMRVHLDPWRLFVFDAAGERAVAPERPEPAGRLLRMGSAS